MRSFGLSLVASLLFASTSFSPAFAQEWLEFRGPDGQGVAAAKNLPLEWDATKNVVWKQPLPGQGWSSPVLANGKLFVTSAVEAAEDAKSYSLRALCLSAVDGKLLWSTELFVQKSDAPKIHRKNSHASPTPLIRGDRLFVHFGHQGTACLDLDGKVIWKNAEIKYAPVHGNGGTPILVGEALIFSCDGNAEPFVVALHAGTGNPLWKTPREPGKGGKKFAFATAQLVSFQGRPQVVSPGANSINAFDPSSGKEIWRVLHGGYSVIPRPVYGHGMVYVSTSYDSPSVLAIRLDGQGDVTDSHVAWTVKKGAPHTPSLLLIGDELYMVSDKGVATCVDAKSGEEIWQERIGGNFSASPLYADGKIYLQSEEGVCTVLRPGRKFEKLATNDLGERSLASFAAADGRLFIRTEGNLFCIGQAGK